MLDLFTLHFPTDVHLMIHIPGVRLSIEVSVLCQENERLYIYIYYMCFREIAFAFASKDLSIRFWNCSDSVVFFVFNLHYINIIL